MYIYIHICSYVRVHICIRMCIHTYVYVYIYVTRHVLDVRFALSRSVLFSLGDISYTVYNSIKTYVYIYTYICIYIYRFIRTVYVHIFLIILNQTFTMAIHAMKRSWWMECIQTYCVCVCLCKSLCVSISLCVSL